MMRPHWTKQTGVGLLSGGQRIQGAGEPLGSSTWQGYIPTAARAHRFVRNEDGLRNSLHSHSSERSASCREQVPPPPFFIITQSAVSRQGSRLPSPTVHKHVP